jgi:hypothetical protein
MKKTLKKIAKINRLLTDKAVELRITEDPLNGFFLKFPNETQKQIEIQEIKIEIKDLLSVKYAKLESLQIEIEKVKAGISCQEKKLTLELN